MQKHTNILIVDDEVSFRKYLACILEDHNYKCLQADSTQEAGEILQTSTIDLCLLDIKMPGKSGDLFLKQTGKAYPDVSFVMLTGVSSLEMAYKCQDYGAEDYLVKPVEPERLLISIHNVLERKRLAQENRFYRQETEKKLTEQAEKLQTSQKILVQQEKLAAIGQLAAGVAHEINNPLGFIGGNLNALQKYVTRLSDYKDFVTNMSQQLPPQAREELKGFERKTKLAALFEDIPELISDCVEGTDRIKTIVQGLKSFSRTDLNEKIPVDVNECLENAITMVWNEIKYNSELERDFADLPPIQGYPQQLSQVFMNLLVNASHAIEKDGLIKITTRQQADCILVSISDNGCGISKENLQKIFNPFFTTKPVGKGTGLGMSIAGDIVQRHGGHIDVESEPGKGTTFRIEFAHPQPETG